MLRLECVFQTAKPDFFLRTSFLEATGVFNFDLDPQKCQRFTSFCQLGSLVLEPEASAVNLKYDTYTFILER